MPFPPTGGTVHVRYMTSSRNFLPIFREQCIRALFTDPQISFFINFFIKNGFHSTIHTFKNYFATVFSVFSFSKISSIQTDPKFQNISIVALGLEKCFILFIFYNKIKAQMGQNMFHYSMPKKILK